MGPEMEREGLERQLAPLHSIVTTLANQVDDSQNFNTFGWKRLCRLRRISIECRLARFGQHGQILQPLSKDQVE